ncbi:MFS transporter [Rickettsia akari]|uniref:MFS transporter n=1 Tax=Rickettsia akari TaxID=786 RepID=UPI0000462186|nr:MFS transporter [Rickettsia akari]
MEEVVGAEFYLTEMTKISQRYWLVASLVVFITLGATVVLALGTLITSFGLDWRLAFWFGAAIAIVGAIARTNLIETPDFIDGKRRIKQTVAQACIDGNRLKSIPIWSEKINKPTAIAFFFIHCGAPLWFYIVYIYYMLKHSFNYSSYQVIHQNFIVRGTELISTIIVTYLVCKIYPLKVLKVRLIIFPIVVIMSHILLNNSY